MTPGNVGQRDSVLTLSHSERQPCALPLDKRLILELIKVGAITVPSYG